MPGIDDRPDAPDAGPLRDHDRPENDREHVDLEVVLFKILQDGRFGELLERALEEAPSLAPDTRDRPGVQAAIRAYRSCKESQGGDMDPNPRPPSPTSVLARELQVYRGALPGWDDREGQYVLIKGDRVIGFWPDLDGALDAGYQRFGLVPFLVRQIRAVEPPMFLTPHVL